MKPFMLALVVTFVIFGPSKGEDWVTEDFLKYRVFKHHWAKEDKSRFILFPFAHGTDGIGFDSRYLAVKFDRKKRKHIYVTCMEAGI
jgi:hypothetical protein